MEPQSPAYSRIIRHFGPEILLENGEIDRRRLGQLVFASEEKRKLLNSITHPEIHKAMLKEILLYFLRGEEEPATPFLRPSAGRGQTQRLTPPPPPSRLPLRGAGRAPPLRDQTPHPVPEPHCGGLLVRPDRCQVQPWAGLDSTLENTSNHPVPATRLFCSALMLTESRVKFLSLRAKVTSEVKGRDESAETKSFRWFLEGSSL